MPKFVGKIGYGVPTEIRPGVWKNEIVEREYIGDIDRIISHNQTSGNLNDDLTMNMQIKVIADGFLYDNFSRIKYIVWMKSKWKVTSIEVKRPRVILNFGGVYNEQSSSTSTDI